MALVTLSNPMRIGPCPTVSEQYPLGSARTNVLDSTYTKHFSILQFPKSGTIEEIQVFVNTVSSAQDIQVSLQTINTSGEASGTAITNGTSSSATPSASAWVACSFSTAPTVSAGLFYAVVTEWSSTAGNIAIGNYARGLAHPYMARWNGSAWSALDGSGMPRFKIKYSDGTFPWFHGQICSHRVGNSYYNRGATYPMAGVRFKVPYPCRLAGFGGTLDLDNVDINAELVLWEDSDAPTAGTSLLQIGDQGSGEDDMYQSGAGNQIAFMQFATKPTIAANTWYRFGLRNSGAGGNTFYGMSADTTAGMEQMNAVDYYVTYSSDSSTWNNVETDAPTLSLLIDQIDDGSGGGGGGGTLAAAFFG